MRPSDIVNLNGVQARNAVLKLNQEGDVVWQQDAGPISLLSPALVDTNDGFAVASHHFKGGTLVTFLDRLGAITSQVRTTHGVPVGLSSDGTNVLVVGRIRKGDGAEADLWAASLSPDGELVWQLALGDDEQDLVNDVTRVYGGYLLAGQLAQITAGDAPANIQGWVARVSDKGEIEWQKTIGGPELDRFTGISEGANGAVLVTGNTKSFGARGHDAWVLLLKGDGTVVYRQQIYGGTGDDVPRAIVHHGSINVLVGNTTDVGGAEGNAEPVREGEAWVLGLGANRPVWQRRLGGPGVFAGFNDVAVSRGGLTTVGVTAVDKESSWYVAKTGSPNLFPPSCDLTRDAMPEMSDTDAVLEDPGVKPYELANDAFLVNEIGEVEPFERVEVCGP